MAAGTPFYVAPEVAEARTQRVSYAAPMRAGSLMTCSRTMCRHWCGAVQVVGCKRTSRASDIFSLGVVAWEMYTGCPPFAQAPGGGLCINTVFPAFPPDRRPPPADVIRLIHR